MTLFQLKKERIRDYEKKLCELAVTNLQVGKLENKIKWSDLLKSSAILS